MARKLRGFVFNDTGSVIEVKLTRQCIEECAHQGKCDDDVEHWVGLLRPQLDEIAPDHVRACLKGYGAWDAEELADDEQNLRRFLWIAACNAKEAGTCWTYMECY